MLRFCVLMGCALCGGFLPRRLHSSLDRVVEWAATSPDRTS